MLMTSLIFGCFEKFLAYTIYLPSFIVVRYQMAELNWEASPPPPSIMGVSRTPSKIGLKIGFLSRVTRPRTESCAEKVTDEMANLIPAQDSEEDSSSIAAIFVSAKDSVRGLVFRLVMQDMSNIIFPGNVPRRWRFQ